MNFLAHLFLAEDTSASLIGNMLGDFSGPDFRERYDEAICRGIVHHRKVDKFTDGHPVFRASKRRIDNQYRLLKGIMIDLFYDHFLARHWRDYAHLSLEKFTENVYAVFREHYEILPASLQNMLPHMIRDNWLVAYREIAGMEAALRGLSRRLSRRNSLATGAAELRKHYAELESDFRTFFPDLQAFSRSVQRPES